MKFSAKESILIFVSLLSYIAIGYTVERTQYFYLLPVLLLLFLAYFMVILPLLRKQGNNQLRIDQWMTVGIVFRLLFLVAIPALSDDYFRFVWDGSMLANGLNPYLIMPNEFIHSEEATQFPMIDVLYDGMNSRQYYTVYPPVVQVIFGIGSSLFPSSLLGNIVVIRAFILIAETATLLTLRQLSKSLGWHPASILIYALNPLVIIELTGNLHLEAIMIFFLTMAIYLLWSGKWKVSAFFMGVSITAKLIPLMLLPIMMVKVGWKKSLLYYGIVGGCVLLLFFPFLSVELIENFSSSVNLYFQSFEFNASIYYIVRWLGYLFNGYNMIGVIGPLMSVVTFGVIMWLLLSKKNKQWSWFFNSMLLALAVYFLMATTVHPWYMSTLVMLAVFVEKSRFALVWSGMVLLSYCTYRDDTYQEIWWLVVLEYATIFAVFLWEFKKKEQSIIGND